MTSIVVRKSYGYSTQADGVRVPLYTDYPAVAQIQELSSGELQYLDGLNIQQNNKTVYLNGNWNGISRPQIFGGDLVLFGGLVWLVVKVPESWPDWTKLIVTLQNQP